ncbi:hypothetical protein SAMN05192571_107119 [Pleomorphomonas diazotrophica]|nr:hypothetical protein SAMN05192571_107119 [Pleomorphomonas diazotrophica]
MQEAWRGRVFHGFPLVFRFTRHSKPLSVAAVSDYQAPDPALHGAIKQEAPDWLIRGLALTISRYTLQLQPLVEPQVSHFRQVPLRTMVKLPHSEQDSPS